MGDFGNKTPTHMAVTHAISKSERSFQNRIPRELDKKFYIPKISMIHIIGYNFLKYKNRLYKKVMSIPNPGFQSCHGPERTALVRSSLRVKSVNSNVS